MLTAQNRASHLLSSLVRAPLVKNTCAGLQPSQRTCRRMSSDIMQGYDQEQVKLMREECILVDENDRVLGPDSKKSCHLNSNIDAGKLHRAFSVFLFDTKGRLLVQQRSKAKITFPEHFANTCCSHPLYFPEELEERDGLGVKRAAQRKLNHELGIPREQVPPECFQFLTRIHYKATSCSMWGEHEIDHILVTQRDVEVTPNPNEVMSYRFVDRDDLKQLLMKGEKGEVKLSPWFQMISEKLLPKWWDNLGDLLVVADQKTIHRLV